MKNNLLIIVYFLFFFIVLSAQTPSGEIHSNENITCSISGILCDGITNMPLSNAYVFALSSVEQEILGYTKTGNIRQTNGFKAGRWRIDKVKPVGDIIVVGFQPETKFNMAIERTFLGAIGKDIGWIETNPPIPVNSPSTGHQVGNSPLDLLLLAGWITHEITTANARDETIALADRLMEYITKQSKLIDFSLDDYFPLKVGYSWTYLIHSGNSGIYEKNEILITITDKISKNIMFKSNKEDVEIFMFEENKATNYLANFYNTNKPNCFVKLEESINFGKFVNNELQICNFILSSEKKILLRNQEAKINISKKSKRLIDVWINHIYPNQEIETVELPYNEDSHEIEFTVLVDEYGGFSIKFSEGIGITQFYDWYADGNTSYILVKKNF